jgi:SagB-type dehydrogenase family enzyme
MSARTGTRVARDFHDRTAHTPYSVRTSGHALDWELKPFLFKIYPDLPVVELPRQFDPVAVDGLAALTPASEQRAAPLTLDALASVLFFSAGLTRKTTYPGGEEIHFRAAPSTGALYQTEVYVVAGPIDGLGAGVYHFSPGDFCLRRLREGDYRAALASAAAAADVGRRPAALILSAIYWRNTWKYQARGYRHLFWDSGTMLANLLAAGGALGLAPRVLTGFVDAEVNQLLGLDPAREAALEVVPLGVLTPAAPPSPMITPMDHAVIPLSSEEVDYPLLRQLHAASMLDTPDAVRARRRSAAPPAPARRGELIALPEPRRASGRLFGETVLRRGSTRQFARDPLGALELSTALWHATRDIEADVPSGLVALYLLVNAVEGIAPGAYGYRPAEHGLTPIHAGEFRAKAGYLCLEQALGADAAAVVFFLAPLDAMLDRWGNRGYRLANLEAGIRGGRLYLAAYGQGFGASGLTFYDAEVVRFFAPPAAGLDAIFVTALGRSVRRASG